MKKYFALLILALAPATALAADYTLNGGGLVYQAPNRIKLQYGTLVMNGSQYSIGQGNNFYDATNPLQSNYVVGATNSCNGVDSNPELKSNSVYYVYYQASTGIIIASTVPPWTDAYPQSRIAFYELGNTNCQYLDSSDSVFAGTFLTDSSSPTNVIPFTRIGNQVTISPSITYTSTNTIDRLPPAGGNIYWGSTISTQSFSSTSFVSQLPASASAAVIEFQPNSLGFTNQSLAYRYYAHILDRSSPVPTGTNPCTTNDQAQLALPLSLSSGVAFSDIQRLTISVNTSQQFTIFACYNSGISSSAQFNINWHLIGYTEDVNHPSVNNQ